MVVSEQNGVCFFLMSGDLHPTPLIWPFVFFVIHILYSLQRSDSEENYHH